MRNQSRFQERKDVDEDGRKLRACHRTFAYRVAESENKVSPRRQYGQTKTRMSICEQSRCAVFARGLVKATAGVV